MLKTTDIVPLRDDLRERLTSFDPQLLSHDARNRALDRFFSVSAGRARAGRYWRIDLESIEPEAATVSVNAARVRIDNPSPHVMACDLLTAARDHPDLLARVFGTTSASKTKFGALAHAFSQLGAFVYVKADAAADDPIVVSYDFASAVSAFPYTVVLAERGARVTIVERLEGGGKAAFVCAATEIVTGEGADVTYAAYQQLAPGSRVLTTRAAVPGRSAATAWAIAELGSDLSVGDFSVSIGQPGARAELTALFFPSASQHVDVVSTIDHVVGDSSSQTIVKSAAVDEGQARYLGNIRIAPR
ncbi:MAG: SufD family Fe-S cluster assembly protein, partial [Candidatus Eremiobacteraeota bacterium]|nr:SufD family Fe-S cluster assembly protein [Candidatus Eremiobacteraeota bacterium]